MCEINEADILFLFCFFGVGGAKRFLLMERGSLGITALTVKKDEKC